MVQPLPPLGELGWRGKYKHDSPEVVELREELKAHAGIKGLEIVDPSQADFAQRAARLFHRDGFVLVKDALDEGRQRVIKSGCDKVIRELLDRDPQRLGNRGSHRYSFGSSPAFFGCVEEWSVLIDPPVVLAVVEAIFESPLFTCSGYGGDFVIPGCTEYQHLHRDISDYLKDPTGRMDYLDLPCARIAVNYPTAVVPGSGGNAHTVYNGATRQIPGTQMSKQPIPTLEEEPRWMKLSTTAPAPAGCAMFRDVRAWHGGTPNLSQVVRAIPSAVFVAPWFNPQSLAVSATNNGHRVLPRKVFLGLSDAGQRVAAGLASDNDDMSHIQWEPDWDVERGVGGGGAANNVHTGTAVAKL